MRLARRLSIAISLGICLVLGINAWMRVRQEREDYRNDVQRDHAAIGRGLASAVEFVWVREGKDVAIQVVDQLNRRESHVTIRWVWRKASGEERNYSPRQAKLVPFPGAKTRTSVVLDARGEPHILTYSPVDVPGGRSGAIELYESLAPEKNVLRRVLVRTLTTTTVLLALSVGLTFGFGLLFVARPLRALGAKAERIGAGDLSGPLVLPGDNEVRDLAITMNAMCDKLSDARARVEQETTARIQAIEQLRHADRLRTVGELASGIAHQLGTPLNVVRVRGSMIASGEIPEARMRELGKVIVEHVDRMSETIRHLLDFARREQPKLASGDLAKAVEQTLRLVEPLAHQRRVKLSYAACTANAPLRMDVGQLHQAVTNIVVNALHATPEGGAVKVELSENEQTYLVDVRDGGEGIAAEHLPHIFEPFYTTKRAGEGTGLGLSVADGIVREHGGDIEAQSAPGHGTLFRLRFPKER